MQYSDKAVTLFGIKFLDELYRNVVDNTGLKRRLNAHNNKRTQEKFTKFIIYVDDALLPILHTDIPTMMSRAITNIFGVPCLDIRIEKYSKFLEIIAMGVTIYGEDKNNAIELKVSNELKKLVMYSPPFN